MAYRVEVHVDDEWLDSERIFLTREAAEAFAAPIGWWWVHPKGFRLAAGWRIVEAKGE